VGDFTFGKDFLTPIFLLFGRRLGGIPPFPVAGQIVKFDGTLWELATGGILSAVQSSSNVGSGDGLALPRVGDDLPFKSLVDNPEVVITPTATTLDFSIGAIAQSKITGLVADLLAKIETLTNVGTGSVIAKPKVGVNVDIRSIIGTAPIIVTQNPNDITISTGLGISRTIMANSFEHEAPADTEFLAVVGISTKAGVENDRHTVMPNAFTLSDLTVEIQFNPSAQTTNLNIRINAVTGNLSASIPAGLTGTFTDAVNTDNVVLGDLIDYQVILNLGSSITFDSASMVVVA